MSDLEILKKTAVLISSIKKLIGEDIFDVIVSVNLTGLLVMATLFQAATNE